MATATPPQKDLDKKATSEPRAALTDIEEHLEKLTAEISSLSRKLADYGNGKPGEAARDARQIAQQLTERSGAAAHAARDKMTSAEGKLEAQIRSHPLAAIGLAVGLGFLVAQLAKR